MDRITYNDDVVRKFIAASMIFGIVGMLVGVIVALQLAWHPANASAAGPWFSFGRLRPLHTNAAIFAFVGNMMFAGIYHSTQRLVKARLFSDFLSNLHFWGWQAIIVAAAISLPMGYTQAKEYAELEWPIDIAITLIWVVFAVNFFGTLAKRREKHLYVAIWFYIATIVTVAALHIVNSLAIPIFAMKSYSVFGGAQDALVQWWYGHNAVAFFLTTPILGIMYYYVPKAAERPVYSYRLSIIHFWALVFIYIWAGPHHLLNTALPAWAQTLGMVFSVVLWPPSWGGMINGLFTIRGNWAKLRVDPVMKFFAAGITFYGMSTFEGPLLSIKSVSALAHYTDWIVAHVHGGTLGWNGLMAFGMFYWLVPRLYGVQLHSKKAADAHFWLATVGIAIYMLSMWTAGIGQGLMLRAVKPDGSLSYATFVETLLTIKPLYFVRFGGGLMYLTGILLMTWNLIATVRAGKPVVTTVDVPALVDEKKEVPWTELLFGKPTLIIFAVIGLAVLTGATNLIAGSFFLVVAAMVAVLGGLVLTKKDDGGEPTWHRLLEGRGLLFTVLTTIAILIGGVAEIVPSLVSSPTEAGIAVKVDPYRPLELEGRDIYIREGCYNCHSQAIRTFRYEEQRYGAVSTLADSRYDHPFQWGSKRTGPDIAREGGKYPNLWHYNHLVDPRAVTAGSNMPPYKFLATSSVDLEKTRFKMRGLSKVGVPYTQADIDGSVENSREQGKAIAEDLKANGVTVAADSEMVALVAYLQRLGKLRVDVAPAPRSATLDPLGTH